MPPNSWARPSTGSKIPFAPRPRCRGVDRDLLTVHPFQDGNGRTARLVHKLHQFATGYALVLIDPTERANYLSVVQKAQIAVPGSGDRTNFHAHLVGLEFRALERYLQSLEIAHGPEHAQNESIQPHEEQRE